MDATKLVASAIRERFEDRYDCHPRHYQSTTVGVPPAGEKTIVYISANNDSIDDWQVYVSLKADRAVLEECDTNNDYTTLEILYADPDFFTKFAEYLKKWAKP